MDTQSRQEQIIRLSLEIIEEHGIQSLTMKEIAKRSEISEQAIYRHFKNKFAILSAIVSLFDEQFHFALTEVDKVEHTLDKIRSFLDLHVAYFETNPAIATVLFSEEIFRNEPLLLRKVEDLIEQRIHFFTELIKKGQQRNEIPQKYDAQDCALITLGAIRFLVRACRVPGLSMNMAERGRSLNRSIVETLFS